MQLNSTKTKGIDARPVLFFSGKMKVVEKGEKIRRKNLEEQKKIGTKDKDASGKGRDILGWYWRSRVCARDKVQEKWF